MPYVKDEDAEQIALTPPDASLPFPSASEDRSGARSRAPTQPSSEPPLPSTGTYERLSPMGTTAYGQAYRARHVVQGREVALHVLALEDQGEDSLARSLPLAVAKCAQLSHQNVIAIEDHGREEGEGRYYLVTAPLEGSSLAAQLDDLGTLPLGRALSITLQIGRALRAAHKLGIVHGALTPANVRLVDSEQGELVRVVGFGSAMFAPPAQRDGSGPVPYEAPECAAGAAPDARSDVFALGALVVGMLTGHVPVVREGEPAPALSTFSEAPVPRDLEELVARCLELRPEARLSDLVVLMRELREIATRLSEPGVGQPLLPLDDGSLPPAEGESSGSLLPDPDANSRRAGAVWILASLMVALAAVWLLWEASKRVRPPLPAPRDPGAPRAP